MKQNISIGEKYGPAMKIVDQKEADEYFEKCVRHSMGFGKSREEADRIEKTNLGYFAGYYDHETRLRIEKLFDCSHPIFGKAIDGRPSPKEALDAGRKIAGVDGSDPGRRRRRTAI